MSRQHRSHSLEFKRQVVQEYLGGETLHGLSKRHDISRQLVRVWIEKYEAVLRDNLDENGGGVSVGTRGEAPRSDRHTATSVFSSARALLVIVTCQVAPPSEGEMRCLGAISTIIR